MWGVVTATVPSFAEPLLGDPRTRTSFNIQSQPLAEALLLYGATTGVEVFYNAALAEERRSNEVVGAFTQEAALQIMLRGTGYIAKLIGKNTFMIAPAPPGAVTGTDKFRQSLQPYFASIQHRIDSVLCLRDANTPHGEVHLQFWLSPSGLVTRAEVVDDDGGLANDQSFAELLGRQLFSPPPTAMPQPVNMVIYPTSKYSKPCKSSDAERRSE